MFRATAASCHRDEGGQLSVSSHWSSIRHLPCLPVFYHPRRSKKAMLKQSTASESEMENTIGFMVCVGRAHTDFLSDVQMIRNIWRTYRRIAVLFA